MHPRWKTQDEFPGSISIPFGIKTSHTWHEIGQILRIINDLDIETFIEIGAHVGGLGSIVSCVERYRPLHFVGVDINLGVVDEKMSGFIVDGDALSPAIVIFLQREAKGRTMYYCDGGNKIAEILLYSRVLAPGDVIACHDYFDGQEVFGLHGFGMDGGKCGCVPEVFADDLASLNLKPLPKYLLTGTRIMGYEN
jgi:hypothetical protein